MQILLLTLITALLASCGSKTESPVPQSSAKIFRLEGERVLQIANKAELQSNDFILLETKPKKSITPKDLKSDLNSYRIISHARCQILEKKAEYTVSVDQSAVQLKTILPLEFFQPQNQSADCDIDLTIYSGSSSKTFHFQNATITKVSAELKNFLENNKTLMPLDNASISENDFAMYDVSPATSGDAVSLICDTFYTRVFQVEDQHLSLEKIARSISVENLTSASCDPRSYIPNQNCVLHVRKKDRVDVSSEFKLNYKPLEPQVKFIDNASTFNTPLVFQAFAVEMLNPHSHPITVALDKTMLSMPTTVLAKTFADYGYKEVVIDTFVSPIHVGFSNSSGILERKKHFVIQLQPQQSLKITFSITKKRNNYPYHRIQWDMNSKRGLIQNLFTNYQTMDEIPENVTPIGVTSNN